MEATNLPVFSLKNVTVDDLTPEVVKQYRDMPASAVEREINKSHIKQLRNRIEEGRSVVFHWATAEIDGVPGLIRINGQHSSEMLSQMDGQMPNGLKVVREHYRCRNGEGLAILFQQFDTRFSTRSPADVAGVYQGLQEPLRVVPKPYAKLAIDGYTWFMRFVEKAPPPIGDEAYVLMADAKLHPFIVWLGETLNSKTRELQPRGVVAAIFGTFDKSSMKARVFWEEVARGGGDPDQADLPTTAIDNWLRGVYEGAIQIDKLGPGNYYQACVNAWNAYLDGKKLTNVRYDVKKSFVSIHE
jgi:hypothetical protein